MNGHKFSPKRKDRIKVIRSIFEGIILFVILVIIVKSLLPSTKYIPSGLETKVQTENGFVAISYFGVDRSGNQTLISTERLKDQLQALKASGYVTVTQQDILDYYQKGSPLPEKALFLIFEDGRRDTGIFAQKIMEELNLKATMLTYAQNLELQDAKFLVGKNLEELTKSSYWELGTSGYRLSYINVFDRHGNFLNQLDTYQFQLLSSFLDRNYNHYLMDYIRDESGIPMETFTNMQERIAWDYKSLKEVYEKELGQVPGMYILMHSNTGQYGSNEKVSYENGKWMSELFQINFNREGNSLNTAKDSLFDLTRMQPQAYWYTNHLLMRIREDTKQEVLFVSGDMDRKSDWETRYGESEFIKDTIVLTSLPSDGGLMYLKTKEELKDFNLTVELDGNKVGTQTLYVRADEELEYYLSLTLEDNIFYLYEKEKGKSKTELYSINLKVHDGVIPSSLEENKLEAKIKELETGITLETDENTVKVLKEQLKEIRKEQGLSATESTSEYIAEIGIGEAGARLLWMSLVDNRISVYIDNKPVVENLEVQIINGGKLFLEAMPSDGGYSQRNLTDDVYDGVFKNLYLTSNGNKKELLLYDNRLSGKDKLYDTIETKWNNLINWFIKYL